MSRIRIGVTLGGLLTGLVGIGVLSALLAPVPLPTEPATPGSLPIVSSSGACGGTVHLADAEAWQPASTDQFGLELTRPEVDNEEWRGRLRAGCYTDEELADIVFALPVCETSEQFTLPDGRSATLCGFSVHGGGFGMTLSVNVEGGVVTVGARTEEVHAVMVTVSENARSLTPRETRPARP